MKIAGKYANEAVEQVVTGSGGKYANEAAIFHRR